WIVVLEHRAEDRAAGDVGLRDDVEKIDLEERVEDRLRRVTVEELAVREGEPHRGLEDVPPAGVAGTGVAAEPTEKAQRPGAVVYWMRTNLNRPSKGIVGYSRKSPRANPNCASAAAAVRTTTRAAHAIRARMNRVSHGTSQQQNPQSGILFFFIPHSAFRIIS